MNITGTNTLLLMGPSLLPSSLVFLGCGFYLLLYVVQDRALLSERNSLTASGHDYALCEAFHGWVPVGLWFLPATSTREPQHETFPSCVADLQKVQPLLSPYCQTAGRFPTTFLPSRAW